jgi:hypothetical protein
MNLQYVIKDFNPTSKVEHNVDSAPPQHEITVEFKNFMYEGIVDQLSKPILDALNEIRNTKESFPPNDFKNVELTDEEISNVRSYMLYISEKYFPDIPLNMDMRQEFIWNIPRPIYETHEYCRLYMYPEMVDPLFWMTISVLDMSPEVICKVFIKLVNAFREEDYNFAKEIIDNNNNEENENE